MPFGSYTKVTRADSDAIFAYLRSVPAGASAEPAAGPALSLQQPLADPGLANPVLRRRRIPAGPDEIRRVESRRLSRRRGWAIARCATRRSTRSAATPQSKAFEGGLIPMQNWYAPSLTSNKEAGLGEWSIDEIVDLLRTGISHRGAVYGPDGGSHVRQPAISERRRCPRDGGLSQEPRPGQPARDRESPHPGAREQPAAAFRPDRLRGALRELPRERTAAACRPNIRRWRAIRRSRCNRR